MEQKSQTPSEPQGSEKSQGLLNILKLIFLAAVLIGAWFVLDWLINGK